MVASLRLALVFAVAPAFVSLSASTAWSETFVATAGGPGLDYAGDMATAPDGDLVVVGAIQGDVAWPEEADVRLLPVAAPGAHRGFVARMSPDGETMRWVTLFPPETFVPSRVAVDRDTIALAGDPLDGMRTHFPAAHGSSYDRGAIVTLSADGAHVLAARGGPPNTPRGITTNRDGDHSGYEGGITGIALHAGLVYATGGTSGAGQGAYIVRYEGDTLAGVDFPHRPDPGRTWAIDLRYNSPDLKEALTWRYDPTHEDATFHQGACTIRLRGNRRGGQVVVVDYDGGTIFGSFDNQYDFNCTGQSFPAFDAGIAAWTLDGELKWATNALDQMVSEPDQGPRAMVWDPLRERLIVALWQHGSNVARLPGTLTGDTGNISIGWVGVIDPANGAVDHAWYQHAVREGTNGEWNADGTVARWPRNSGNTVHRLAVDAASRVFVLSSGGNQMFTTEDALMDWPTGLFGAHATLTVLSDDLQRVAYATMLRGPDHESRGSVPAGLAVNRHGVHIYGRTAEPAFVRRAEDRAAWSTAYGGDADLFFARIGPEALPFEPSAPVVADAPDPSPDPSPDPGPVDDLDAGDLPDADASAAPDGAPSRDPDQDHVHDHDVRGVDASPEGEPSDSAHQGSSDLDDTSPHDSARTDTSQRGCSATSRATPPVWLAIGLAFTVAARRRPRYDGARI